MKGAVSGTERCTISAFPCASDMGEPARAQVEHLASLDDQNLSGEDRRRAERAQERREAAREDKREEQREERRDQIREDVREDRRDERDDRREPSFVDRDLNPQEVRELQHLLSRAGYNVRPDGVFGDEFEGCPQRLGAQGWDARRRLSDLRGFGEAAPGHPVIPFCDVGLRSALRSAFVFSALQGVI